MNFKSDNLFRHSAYRHFPQMEKKKASTFSENAQVHQ